MKAKKKPLATYTPQDLNVDITPRLEVLSVTEPPPRQGGGTVGSVDELVSKLKEVGAL